MEDALMSDFVTLLHVLHAGLTNDVKAINGHIEDCLHALHAAARAQK
jgi:hypothetical protein